MSSDLNFVQYICDQMGGPARIAFRKMFGEYAIYSNGKVLALVCDNQLFIKPTVGGKNFIGNVEEAPPYQGAKLYFLIGEQIDDRDWLSELIQITESELPIPIKKKKQIKDKKKKGKRNV